MIQCRTTASKADSLREDLHWEGAGPLTAKQHAMTLHVQTADLALGLLQPFESTGKETRYGYARSSEIGSTTIVIAETIHVDIPFIVQIIPCINSDSGSEETTKAGDLEGISQGCEPLAVGAE